MECRRMITAFRIMPHPTDPGRRAADNITHEPGLTYEEAVEPFLDIVCHRCETTAPTSDEREAVEAGWICADGRWACPTCRLLEMGDVLDVGGICGAMRDRAGKRITDDLERWADAATICRRDHGHAGGCHFESV